MLSVTSISHPFNFEPADIELPEGLTVLQIMEAVQPDPILGRHAHVFLDDQIIPREYWHVVRPKTGVRIAVRVVAGGGGGGGGKNPLRTVLTIAVIAAAFAFGGPLGSSLFGSSIVNAGLSVGLTVGQGIALTTALGGAIISIGGNLLINAIAPVRPPSAPALSGSGSVSSPESPTLSIAGARNAPRPFDVIPVVLGRHKHTPPLGTRTFTEAVGEEQYLRMLVIWGYGPLKVSDIKIGNTPIEQFAGVQIETREGRATDEPLTLIPNTVKEESFSILLSQSAGFQTRNSEIGADELSVDILFPQGIVTFSDRGTRGNRTVELEIEFREVGGGAWLQPSFTATTVDASGINGNIVTIRAARSSAVRHGFRWSTPSRGQYEIRIRRNTADSSSTRIFDQFSWVVLRTITDEDPLQFEHELARTALVVQATDQLNQVIDELNAITESYVLDWNGAFWSEGLSRNPASLFRHVLQANSNGAARPDSRVDLPSLQGFHDFCLANGFEFNMVRDFQSSVWDTLADIAAAGRGSPTQINGKWGVVWDSEQTIPRQHFTPRNSFGFEMEKAFPDTIQALRVRFINEDADYGNDERIVYDDGFDATNAQVFNSADAPGQTAPDQIWKWGRFQIAQSKLRPERWTLHTDFEFLVARRGDLVAVTHDVILVGIATGRVKALQQDGSGNTTGFTSDETLTMEADKSYGVAFRTVNNNEVVRTLVTNAGDQTTVVFQTPIAAASGPQTGDLFGFGETGLETVRGLIVGIEPSEDLQAKLDIIPQSPAIYQAETGTIPAFQSQITPLPDIPQAVVDAIFSDESALTLGAGNTLLPGIQISLADPGQSLLELEVQTRTTGSTEHFASATVTKRQGLSYLVGDVDEGQSYDLRVRWRAEGRLPSAVWTPIFNHLVIGQSSPPAPLLNLTISAFGGSALLRWDEPSELDVRFGGIVRFRHHPSTDPVLAVWNESVGIGDFTNTADLVAQLPLKEGTYLARVFDKGGRHSDTLAKASTKQASVLSFANVNTVIQDPSFTGAKSGVIVTDNQLALDSGGDFDSLSDFDAVPLLDSEGGTLLNGTYDFASGLDLVTVQRVRLTTDLMVLSENVLDPIDSRPESIDAWEDFDGVDQAVGDLEIQVRSTDDDPAGSPTFTDWQKLDSAEFEARAFEFRARLSVTDPAFNIRCSRMRINVEDLV